MINVCLQSAQKYNKHIFCVLSLHRRRYHQIRAASYAFKRLAPVVQTSDSAIHRINLYPVDSAIDFHNTYPLDSDLSGG